jgi:hypothetical protein
LWDLFGLRAWHDHDLASVDHDELELLIASAKAHERKMRQEVKRG